MTMSSSGLISDVRVILLDIDLVEELNQLADQLQNTTNLLSEVMNTSLVITEIVKAKPQVVVITSDNIDMNDTYAEV